MSPGQEIGTRDVRSDGGHAGRGVRHPTVGRAAREPAMTDPQPTAASTPSRPRRPFRRPETSLHPAFAYWARMFEFRGTSSRREAMLGLFLNGLVVGGGRHGAAEVWNPIALLVMGAVLIADCSLLARRAQDIGISCPQAVLFSVFAHGLVSLGTDTSGLLFWSQLTLALTAMVVYLTPGPDAGSSFRRDLRMRQRLRRLEAEAA